MRIHSHCSISLLSGMNTRLAHLFLGTFSHSSLQNSSGSIGVSPEMLNGGQSGLRLGHIQSCPEGPERSGQIFIEDVSVHCCIHLSINPATRVRAGTDHWKHPTSRMWLFSDVSFKLEGGISTHHCSPVLLAIYLLSRSNYVLLEYRIAPHDLLIHFYNLKIAVMFLTISKASSSDVKPFKRLLQFLLHSSFLWVVHSVVRYQAPVSASN